MGEQEWLQIDRETLESVGKTESPRMDAKIVDTDVSEQKAILEGPEDDDSIGLGSRTTASWIVV